MDHGPYLTKQELQAILHVGKTTLQSFIRRREIKFYRIGRRVLFKPRDVESFVNRRVVPAKRAKRHR